MPAPTPRAPSCKARVVLWVPHHKAHVSDGNWSTPRQSVRLFDAKFKYLIHGVAHTVV